MRDPERTVIDRARLPAQEAGEEAKTTAMSGPQLEKLLAPERPRRRTAWTAVVLGAAALLVGGALLGVRAGRVAHPTAPPQAAPAQAPAVPAPPSPSPPPSAHEPPPHALTRTSERDAADRLAAGDYAAALSIYEALSQHRATEPVFAGVVAVLRARVATDCGTRAQRGLPPCD